MLCCLHGSTRILYVPALIFGRENTESQRSFMAVGLFQLLTKMSVFCLPFEGFLSTERLVYLSVVFTKYCGWSFEYQPVCVDI